LLPGRTPPFSHRETRQHSGIACAGEFGVTAKKFEEIVAWQLADELRQQIVAVSGTGSFSKDFKLSAQIRDAANSASANIAEGFKRFNPREFGQFMKYSRASLAEINIHLNDARDRHHISATQHAEMTKLAARAAIAAARLHAYLRKAKPPVRQRTA
jgi:four helix bundle protein